MALREDLLELAATFTAKAREKGDDEPLIAAELTDSVKVALEAAQIAGAVPPDEIAQAVDKLREELARVGLEGVLTLAPVDMLRVLLGRLEEANAQMENVERVADAYKDAREFLERLERDFLAGDTDTSRRIAARIRGHLDDHPAIHRQT